MVQWWKRHAGDHVAHRAWHQRPNARHRFSRRAGVLSCVRMKGQFNEGILPYAPVRVFQGSADEEVSPRRCADLVAKSRALGGDIQFRLYTDATHDFDDPSPSHQNNDANADATDDVIARATEFLASVLTTKP
jgi:hypothetical protein